MTKKLELSEEEARTIFRRISDVPIPRGTSALQALRMLHNVHPNRVGFEIGVLKDPGRHLVLEATPC